MASLPSTDKIKLVDAATSKKEEKKTDKQVSFFDKMMSFEKSKQAASDARSTTANYIAKQDTRSEEKMMIRRIANNTDTIIDILKDMKDLNGKDKSGFDWKKLLPLLPLIPGFLDPEKMKEISTSIKAMAAAVRNAEAIVKGVKAGAVMAKEVATGTKAASAAAKGTDAAVEAVKAGSKVADVAATAGKGAKALAAMSKVGNSNLVHKGLRYAGIGMTAGRLYEGDYTGAGMEASSLAMSEGARKVKNPKLKLLLTGASFATDAAILARDWWKGKEKDVEKATKDGAITKDPEKIKFPGEDGSSVPGIAALGLTGAAAGGILATKYGKIAKAGMSLSVPGILGGIAKTGAGAGNALKNVASSVFQSPTKIMSSIGGTIAKAGTAAKEVGVAGTIAKDVGGKVLAKGGAKMAAKLIPGAGLALGAYGAYQRGKDGDYLGAAAEAVSGVASLFPVVGTAIAGVIQGGLLYRDMVKVTAQDTKELNGITKASAAGLDESADKNAKSVDAANESITKNASDMSKSVDGTNKSLSSFVTGLGGTLGGWLKSGTDVFATAVKTLFSVHSAIFGLLGSLANKVKNFFGFGAPTTTDPSVPGHGPIDYKVNTASGGASLGAHGGTMTGSIKHAESGGNYNVFNTPGTYKKGQLNASNTTLDQIIGAQNNKQVHAFGAYQIIGSTMKAAKSQLGLKGNEKMTPELQDKIYREYLVKKKRPMIYNYITAKDGTNLNSAILAMAMEWASVGVPHDMKGHKRWVKKGESYYAGDGINKASISPEEAGAGLEQQRARYLRFIKAGMSPQDAYTKSFQKDAGDDTSMAQKAGSVVGGLYNAAKDKVKDLAGTDGEMQKLPSKGDGKKGVPPLLARRPVGNMAPTAPNAKNIVDAAGKATGTPIKSAAPPKATTGTVAAAKETPQKADNKNAKAAAKYDLDKMVDYAYSNAKAASTGKCALFVRKAIEAGYGKAIGGLGDAKDYIQSLPRIGFKNVGKNLTSFVKGDIAVFPKTKSQWGHVCIWTGALWVSDFKQNRLQPYSGSTFEYHVFRAISGSTNGTAVGSAPTDAKGGTIEAAGADGTVSGGEGAESKDKSIFDQAIDAAVKGVADVAAALGNSETVKAALDFVNSAKVDPHVQKQGSDVNRDGFEKTLKGHGPAYQYKYAKGGGLDEDVLFNPNLERQKEGSDVLGEAGKMGGIVRQREGYDVLGSAGYIPGIQRQREGWDVLGQAGHIPGIVRQQEGWDVLGQAGHIPGIVRQQEGWDVLGQAGSGSNGTGIGSSSQGKNSKKKKLKWWERLFKNGKEIFGDISGILDEFGISFDGTGESGSLKTKDYMGGMFELPPMPEGSGDLRPDLEGRDKVDGYISSVNRQYEEFKRAPQASAASSNATNNAMQNMAGSKMKSNTPKADGLTGPIITRNPDSIFRVVSITMMKASTS